MDKNEKVNNNGEMKQAEQGTPKDNTGELKKEEK